MNDEQKHIKLRTVFMGTSHISEIVLKELLENGYNIAAVYTKPDAKVGRKRHVEKPAVKFLAEKNNIPIFQPEKFRGEAINEFKKLKPDLVITVAFGKILPKEVLDEPGFGCINLHASLLPKFRGPSPIQNAILLGENETGVTVMHMDQGVDTGDMLSQEKILIDPSDNLISLSEKVAFMGSELLLRTIPDWIEGKIKPTPQDHFKATLCQLIEREDGKINWTDDTKKIFNTYRALTPWPGVFTFFRDNKTVTRIKILDMEIVPAAFLEETANLSDGQVLEVSKKVIVKTRDGFLEIKGIQKEGKKEVSIKDFVNGNKDFIGSILI